MVQLKLRLLFYNLSFSAYSSPLLMIIALATNYWLYSTELVKEPKLSPKKTTSFFHNQHLFNSLTSSTPPIYANVTDQSQTTNTQKNKNVMFPTMFALNKFNSNQPFYTTPSYFLTTSQGKSQTKFTTKRKYEFSLSSSPNQQNLFLNQPSSQNKQQQQSSQLSNTTSYNGLISRTNIKKITNSSSMSSSSILASFLTSNSLDGLSFSLPKVEYIVANYGLWKICFRSQDVNNEIVECKNIKYFQGSDSENRITDTIKSNLKRNIFSCLK